jgi:hypothetical protein
MSKLRRARRKVTKPHLCSMDGEEIAKANSSGMWLLCLFVIGLDRGTFDFMFLPIKHSSLSGESKG